MQRTVSIFAVLFTITLAIQATAQPSSESQMAQEKQKPTLAVTTFEHLSAYPENVWVAMSFSEALTVKLKRLYERFRVVERVRVYEVIREQGIDPENVGVLEPTTQKDIGNLIGANYLIFGSVSLQGLAEEPTTKLLASMRTVDVQTGEIKETASISGMMQEIFDLEIQLALAFLKQVGVDPTAVEEQLLSIKETESLLAEKYYNLGNKAYYDADYPAAEAWYQKAVAITEGGYHREAALRWVDVLKRQQAAAQAVKDETVLEAIREKAGQRIKTIEQRQAEANEMNFEKAELFMIRGEYEAAIEAYQLYLAKAKRLLKWKTDIDMKGFLNVAIVVNDSLLLFNHRHLMMLDTETGNIRWKFNSLDSFSEEQLGYVYSEPVVTDGVVYWRSGGVLYALAKEAGEIRWEFTEGPKAPSYWTGVQEWSWCHWDAPPVVAEGLVYIRLSTGILVALDKETGEQKWEFDTESLGYSVRTNRIPAWGLSIPVVRKGILYTQYGRGIAALKADTGETVWYRELPSAPGWLCITFDEPNQANQESESWTVKLKRLFIPPEEGVVVRGFASTFLGGNHFVEESDLASGDRIVETAGVPIKTQADLVRVTSAVKPNDQISIKVMRGAGKFETALSVPYRVVILPTMQGNLLYAFVNDTLSALDADTGEIQWSFSDPAGIKFALISDGTLYCAVNSIQEGWFQGGDRARSWMQEEQLYAIDSQTGKIRWQQPHKTTLEDFSLWQSAGLSPFHPDSGEPQPLPLNHYPFAVMGDQIVSETYGMDKPQVVFTDVKTGQPAWEFFLPTYGELFADNETIYLVGGEAVYAFDTMLENVTPLFENTPALLGLGRAYRLLGKYQKAIQPLQKAAEWHVDDLGTYRELALVYEDMERWSLAASYWDKYLSVIPPGGEAPQEIKDHLWEFAGLRWWNKDYNINHVLVHNGVAYFGLAHLAKYMSAAIVGLSLQTGASQWSVGAGSDWPFALGDGRLFVYDGGSMSSTEGVESRIKAISLKSSQTQWQTTIQYRRNVRTFPSLKLQFDRGLLYVQSHTYDESTFHWVSVLHALDGETGKVLWHYQQEGQGKYAKFIKFGYLVDELPHLVIGEFIYWKARRGRLYALHPKTGELIWKFERAVEGVDWEAAQPYLLWPVLLGETLFTDLGDTFYAFDAKSGAIRWQFSGHWIDKIVANPDRVVLQTNDPIRVWDSGSGIISTRGPESSMLYALDSQTGEILWRKPDWSQRIALRNDILYLFGRESLKVLSVETGQAQWTREHLLPNDIEVLPNDIEDLVIQNQTAFLLTKDYGEGYQEPVLYAIDLINRTNLWRLNLVSRWSGNQIVYADENTLILFINRAAIYAIDLAQARRSKLALAAQESDANQLGFLSGLRDEIINRRDEIQALLSEAHQPRFAQMIELLTSYDGDAQGSFGNHLTGKQFKGLRTDIVPMLIALWKVERSTPSSEPGLSETKGTTATPSDDERNRVIQRALLALGDASIVPDLEEIITYNGYAGPVLAKLQGDAAIPKLLDALQGHAVYYAEGIMQALATLKAKEAVPILSQRLVDAETMQEKLIIAVYLREIGDASAIPALQKAFAQAWEQLGGEGTVSACYAISSALCAVGDKKGVDGLIQLLERVDSISDGSSRILDILMDLTQYTGHDFDTGHDFARSEDKPEAHLREIAQKYRAWWEANKEKLIWSEEQRRFVSK